jgi:hypothetical protein
MRDAAEMTVIERARQLFETPGWNGSRQKLKNAWKGSLKDSLRARTTRKSEKGGPQQKYSSLIIEYGPTKDTVSSKGYWKRFESGGKHGDWPLKRMAKWMEDKFGIKEKKMAFAAARSFIKNYLEVHGAEEYKLLENAWSDSKEQFIVEWRTNLRNEMSGDPGSIPF